MSSIPLSNEKISFTASLQEGWSGGQGSGDKSRAVKPDFPGLAREQKVLTTDEAFSKPLYLHPIETVNKTLKNQGPTTRGIMNESKVVDNFGVSANYIQNEGSAEESFFQNKEAKKEGSNWFVADNVKWPAAGTVYFYAYAPYNDKSLQWNGEKDVTKNKTIHYIVPTDVEKQPDFIVAKSEGKSFSSSSANTPVDLQFSHALTAITFSVSDDMEKGKINSITIEGVKGEGDYNLSTKVWSVSSSSAASYNVPISARGLTVGTGTVDLAPNATLMMIPQTLGGAKVTIKFTPTGKKDAVDLTFKLENTHWDPGNHVTYLLSTTKIIKLNMGSVTYPKWQTAEGSPFTPKNLKSDYASGDSIGMYVVDKNNKVIEENLKFTYNDNDSKWTVEPGKEFKGSPQYNYFVYYPYQSEGLPGAPDKNTPNINVTSAENFFADAIDTWKSSKITADQSTLDMMNACDLQIGKASLDEDGCSVSFMMEHAMGLAEITLGAKTFEHANYKLFNYESYTWTNKTTFHAYAGISGYSFYQVADYRYVALVKPGETTGFSCGNTTDADAWTENVLSVKPAANGVAKVTATSKRTPESYILYKMDVGDIYYSDGAMTHQSEDLAFGKTPIGIVGYLGSNYWTEKDTKEKGIGGHALVMCLKHIGSTKTSDLGYSYQWCTFNGQTSHRKLSMPEILNSFEKDYGSGYLMTKDFWLSSSYPAFQAVKNYNEGKIANAYTFPKDKCTGWFIPTVGQFYAVLSQLGQYSGTFTMGVNLGSDLPDKINAALMKVGPDNYTEFFQSSSDNLVWTTTEINTVSTLAFIFRNESFLFDTLSGSNRYGYPCKVRPFLAF